MLFNPFIDLKIMKKYLLLLLVIISLITQAQDSTWIRTFSFDKPIRIHDLIETYDKGFLTANTLKDDLGHYKYCLLTKTDINGNILWEKYINYQPASHDWVNSGAGRVTQTADGGLLIQGVTYQFDLQGDMFVLKLNACGKKEWSRIFRIDEMQWSRGVFELDNGDIMLLVNGYDWDAPDYYFLVKLKSTGETIWAKKYGVWEGEYCTSSASDCLLRKNNGNFVTVGQVYKAQPPDTVPYWIRPEFIEIDTAGNEIWHNAYTDHYFVGDTRKGNVDTYGNLYAGGRMNHADTNYYGGEPASLYKLDSFGNMLWFKPLVDTVSQLIGSCNTVSVMCDSLLFLSPGYLRDETGDVDSLVVYIVKTDTAGNVLQKRLISVTAEDANPYPETKVSITTSDNKLLIGFEIQNYPEPNYYELRKYNKNLEYDSIYTATYTYDSLCPHAIQSDTINLDTTVVNLNEVMIKLGVMSLYPNPASSKVRIEINVVKRIPRVLMVVSPTGKTVYNTVIAPGRANAVVDVSSWPAGFYLFTLFEKGIPVQTGKLAVVR